jgi:hypothetical protein
LAAAVNPWWMMPLWGVLGALVGGPLPRLTQASLTAPDRDHPLSTASTVSSATAVLFGLLGWRVGVRPELLADSALTAVCVQLAMIDLVEQRILARLLLPAYPSLAGLEHLPCRCCPRLGLRRSHRRHDDPPAPGVLAHPDAPRPSPDRGSLHRPAHPSRMITQGTTYAAGCTIFPAASGQRGTVVADLPHQVRRALRREGRMGWMRRRRWGCGFVRCANGGS